jgi:hypothetical protein
MSTDNNLNELVIDGIRFLESMARYYGSEKGMELYEKFGEVLGTEVKGKIFFGMLTGETSFRMRVQRGSCTSAVEAIKAIRMHTGMSLLEAKKSYDLSSINETVLECLDSKHKKELSHALNRLGMYIS